MTNLDITHRRLFNRQLAQPAFENPADLAQWLGAVQAQDYPAARWAVGQRLSGTTDAWSNRPVGPLL